MAAFIWTYPLIRPKLNEILCFRLLLTHSVNSIFNIFCRINKQFFGHVATKKRQRDALKNYDCKYAMYAKIQTLLVDFYIIDNVNGNFDPEMRKYSMRASRNECINFVCSRSELWAPIKWPWQNETVFRLAMPWKEWQRKDGEDASKQKRTFMCIAMFLSRCDYYVCLQAAQTKFTMCVVYMWNSFASTLVFRFCNVLFPSTFNTLNAIPW